MNQRAEELKRKALLYERTAGMATDPDACRAYLELARQLQVKAKQTEAFERIANLRQGIWWPEPVRRDDEIKISQRSNLPNCQQGVDGGGAPKNYR
jgi:hypothetical protein